jgi:hypothetical protein
MAIYLRALGLVLFLYAISAMPLEGQEEPKNDLFSVDSAVQTESAGNSDDLTRNRRHGYGGYGK